MNNNKISLSLFIDVYRTYVTVTQCNNDTKGLLYINSTEYPLTTSTLANNLNTQGIEELQTLIRQLNYSIDEINVSLPNNHFVTTQIPYKDKMIGDELKELIELEIKYHYENTNIFNLNCILTPFFDNNKSPDYIFLTLFEKRINEILNDLFVGNKKVNKILTSQFAALNSFIYNYPETSNDNVILYGIYENGLEISLLNKGKPVTIYYKSFDDTNNLLQVALDEYNNLRTDSPDTQYRVVAYGNRLTADILEKLDLSIGGNNVGRLNAFRQYTTQLDDRTKKYCSRTAHIYPAVLGASLPDFTEHILLFPDENN